MPYIVLVSQEARERVAELRRQILGRRSLSFKEVIESTDTGFWHTDYSPGWPPSAQEAHYKAKGVPVFIPGVDLETVEEWLFVWEQKATDLELPPELIADFAAPVADFWRSKEPQAPKAQPLMANVMGGDPTALQAQQGEMAQANDRYQAEHEAWQAKIDRIEAGDVRQNDILSDYWRRLFELDKPQASRHLRNFVNLVLRSERKKPKRKPAAATDLDMGGGY